MNDSNRSAGVVELVTNADGGTAMSWWWPGLLVLAGVLILLGLVLVLRRYNRRDPLDRAFARMARKLRLAPDEKARLRQLAARTGAAPAALLVSRSALDHALRGETEQPGVRERQS